MSQEKSTYVRLLRELNNRDIAEVGGKNASLGEMIGSLSERGIQVPGGFATTATAYRSFIEANGLEQSIAEMLEEAGKEGVAKVGPKIRQAIMRGKWPPEVEAAIRKAYREFSEEQGAEASVAVRSSATAEDLPEASFAGQQETYLNVSGEDAVLEACRKCYASLFTDRAISYREEKNFDHMAVALSAGVQLMVRGDTGASGVMFTLDTDSGFREVVVINGAWGLGETVVGGEVNPDEYVVFKPKLDDADCLPVVRRSRGEKAVQAVYSKKKDRQIENKATPKKDRRRFVLSDAEAVRLAGWGKVIEEHYAKPMDIEWAKDGETDELYILQARPETVESQKDRSVLTTYSLESTGKELVSGIAIGQAAATGKVRKLSSPDQGDRFKDGDVLVTEMTDPDWGPIMKRAAAIVTDKGGRTAHAAIVSRELGIPAIVGAGEATEVLSDGQAVTIDCTRGSEGYIYEGELPVEKTTVKLDDMPETKTEIMMNLASPEAAFRWASLPTRGVGLARIEFIINNTIQAHPLALLDPAKVEDKEARAEIRALLEGWEDGSEFFIRQLSEGIATIAASQYPKPTIVRLSDFKTNEYAELIGGSQFEGAESNPMLGFRGAARYQSEHFKEAFALECAALKRARESIGMDNIVIMIPFCRTPEEVDGVLAAMAENGLVRGEKGLQVYLMAEVPANVFQAENFAARCDGFSIGSNDLTQLVLGISRDSEALSPFFNEMDLSVTTAIEQLIEAAHKAGIKIGICGQGPSDKPEFAEFLVRHGIDSMSLNPDSVVKTLERVAKLE
ncbi:MAG: phosphoenolpyruvate synthase [Verrucomicrobiota bacterium]